MAIEETWVVRCHRHGKTIAAFDFKTHPLPRQPTSTATLIDDAKGNLSTLGLANPPYAGIEFQVDLVSTTSL